MALFMELNIQIDSLFPLPGLFWEGIDKHHPHWGGKLLPWPPSQADNGQVSLSFKPLHKSPVILGAEAQRLGCLLILIHLLP